MIGLGVEVIGLDDAKRALAELHPKKQRQAERTALRAGGNVWRRRAMNLVPVRTGRLRSRGISVSVSVKSQPGISAELHLGTGRVGMFNELGTRKMAAQPWMRPALKDSEQDIVRAYGETFKKAISRAIARQSRG